PGREGPGRASPRTDGGREGPGARARRPGAMDRGGRHRGPTRAPATSGGHLRGGPPSQSVVHAGTSGPSRCPRCARSARRSERLPCVVRGPDAQRERPEALPLRVSSALRAYWLLPGAGPAPFGGGRRRLREGAAAAVLGKLRRGVGRVLHV